MVCKEKAREYFEKGCNEYLRLFCEKHGFDFEDAKDSWVSDSVGGVVCVGDFFVDMETIIADIEMDAPEEEFFKWYDYSIAASEFDLTQPNLSSWLKGCPRTSEETFAKLRELKDSLQGMINEEKKKAKSE